IRDDLPQHLIGQLAFEAHHFCLGYSFGDGVEDLAVTAPVFPLTVKQVRTPSTPLRSFGRVAISGTGGLEDCLAKRDRFRVTGERVFQGVVDRSFSPGQSAGTSKKAKDHTQSEKNTSALHRVPVTCSLSPVPSVFASQPGYRWCQPGGERGYHTAPTRSGAYRTRRAEPEPHRSSHAERYRFSAWPHARSSEPPLEAYSRRQCSVAARGGYADTTRLPAPTRARRQLRPWRGP